MDCIKKGINSLPWKAPLISLLSDNHWRDPLYGPLNIENYQQYLDDGKQLFNEYFYIKFPRSISLEEFNFLCVIAEGGFGKIVLAEQKNAEKPLYAMKAIDKSFVIETNSLSNVLNEKRMLQSLHCPFLIRLEHLCQSSSHIYMFMPFISGGDLFTHLRRATKFGENLSKFYAAQMVLAIEFMQNCDVAHRDLKPENILIDHHGFIKLTDFGLSKVVSARTYTFCGTVEYAAPELVLGKGYGKAVDWWSLGVLIFEMVFGKVPFSDNTELGTFEKILLARYTMPKEFSQDLKTLVKGLLQRDPLRRFGNLKLGAEEVKRNHWFSSINWLELLNRKVVPPFIPDTPTRLSEANFPQMAPLNMDMSRVSASSDKHFKDF